MVSEETVDNDPEVFDCDRCPVIAQLDALDPFNRRVWDLYRDLVSRFAADVHTGGEALRRLTADLSDEDFRETWRRLCVLYDVVDPPPEPTKG